MDPLWIDPQRILTALEGEADPGEVEQGRVYHRQRRARVQQEDRRPGRVESVGTVVGSRLAPHHTTLTITPSRVDARCDCRLRPWPCRHVLAFARTWAEEAQLAAKTGWRALLSGLAPRVRRPAPEAAQQVFAHWLELRRPEGGAWSLWLSWRVHRPGARGLGRGRPVSRTALAQGMPAEAGPADRQVVERAVAAAEPASPAGGRGGLGVLLWGEAVDPVLRALAKAPWVFWAESREAVGFSTIPVTAAVVATTTPGGLWLRARLGEPGHPAEEAASIRVVGGSPPWVEREGTLRPVAGVEDGAALAALLEEGAAVPEEEWPAFLGSAVPELEARGIAVEIGGLEDRTFLVAEQAAPRLYLGEEEGALVGTLRFGYGDYEVAADSPEPVLKVGAGARRAYLRRDMETEFEAVQRLRGLGFRLVEPGRFEIEGDAALDFLRTDFDGLAHDWEVFGRDDLRRYRLSTATPGLRIRLGADLEWLDLGFEAEADGDLLPAEEVIRALRKGSRYVRLGDGRHAPLPQQWLERLAPVLEELNVKRGRARLPHYLAPLVEEVVAECPAAVYEGREVWSRLVSVLEGRARAPELPLPAGLTATLRPYQVEGYRWLRFMGDLSLGGVLADDMGLGKTVQALAVLVSELEEGRTGPNLVVAPTSVVPNWEAEARRFAPGLRVLRYQGADRKAAVGEMSDFHLVVTSYALLRRDVDELAAFDWNYAILDEAQAIKNAATQTARAARRIQARRRLALTGTPLENHLGELWSQFQFLMPGLLGTERQFARRFAKPIVQGDAGARQELERRVRPFVLRRLKSQVARELPAKVESVLGCELLPDQERLYRSLLEASRERVLRDLDRHGLARGRFSALEALLRLRQVCCHPAILPGDLGRGVPSAKFELFREFVAEVIEEGHRVLVFSQFVKALGILREWFDQAGIPHLYLDGRTPDREGVVARFQEDASVAAFLVSLKAGGSGLNLTGADYVILYDPWWNPAVEVQAADRAHRIGQTRKVFSYKLITRGTVEEKILTLQERKRDLTEGLLGTGTRWLGGLGREEIEDLFR